METKVMDPSPLYEGCNIYALINPYFKRRVAGAVIMYSTPCRYTM